MPNDNDPPRNRPWERGGGGRDRDDDDRPRRRDEDDRPRRRDRDRDEDNDPPRRRRYEDEDDLDRPRRGGSRAEASNGLATAGLILGVLALCAGPLTGIPALICSALALGKPTGRGMAIAGVVLGGLGTIVGAVGWYFAFMALRNTNMRVSDANNMKQIGLAIHAHHDARGFMTPYTVDDSGKVQTGLSFRVGILPYVEQQGLYRKFDLTQPWDSPTNRPASNTPLKVYTSPYDGGEASANTPYRVFVGGGAMFETDPRARVSLMTIADGTSNTIMMVHAVEYVPWAEPRELNYSPNAPIPRFGHAAVTGGSTVLMADGSVRFIRNTVPERTMRALITRADGEVIPGDF